ncbi:MAG TPA: bifunctional 2-polyprenyl-6-hydroxyphenol methylase/3-demethylubiquinol 3-O-methyltransferase UbiG [Steroidobacteraceae bacterium]|nr:bifunctional 2-polyprenyl-6-hydroxyphenol methylase/3-demethylubiquinol 3-O-methyltransferase UbiG [Steroidobacteraceae bacterium]
MTDPAHNVDPAEIGRFDALAARWWDERGEFAPLHRLNPVRLAYLKRETALEGARVLDVGCGGGILTEALAREGARVCGVDLSARALETAALHALETGLAIDYRCISAEALAAERPAAFDVVTCMEMLEHVPDPSSAIGALARLVRPGGDVFVSTINRNLKAFAIAIVAAEYLTGAIPRGTHEYARFIRPAELGRAARGAGLEIADLTGIVIDPLTREFALAADVGVNYLMHLRRPAAGAL